ncbi:MAG TPA: hypothetical protein EYO76_13820, partial [Flavobacteriaceae bacterium]|nr:hypothetical protein [Flavobacteriaceae bacterium]
MYQQNMCEFCMDDLLIETNEGFTCLGCSRVSKIGIYIHSQDEYMQPKSFHPKILSLLLEICARYNFPDYIANKSVIFFSKLKLIPKLQKKNSLHLACFALLKQLVSENIFRNLQTIFSAFNTITCKHISSINSILINGGNEKNILV